MKIFNVYYEKRRVYISPGIKIVEVLLECGIALSPNFISAGDDLEENVYEL